MNRFSALQFFNQRVKYQIQVQATKPQWFKFCIRSKIRLIAGFVNNAQNLLFIIKKGSGKYSETLYFFHLAILPGYVLYLKYHKKLTYGQPGTCKFPPVQAVKPTELFAHVEFEYTAV
jgi:hypothetical protein